MRSPLAALGVGVVAIATIVAVGACTAFTSDDTPKGKDAGMDVPATPPDEAQAPDSAAPEAGPAGVDAVVLASGLNDLQGIAATETNVYFVERGPGVVHVVPIEGGMVADVVRGPISPSSIAVVGGTLVWGDYGKKTISFRDLDGTAVPNPTTIVQAPVAITPIPGGRYLLVSHAQNDVGDVQEYSLPLIGGALHPSGVGKPIDVAVSDTAVYWTESQAGTIGTGTLDDSTSPAPFVTGEDDCASIAADIRGVYWTRPSAGLVRAAHPPQTAVTSLAPNEKGPSSLALDGSGLYWLTSDGKLRRSTLEELPIQTISQGFAASLGNTQIQAIALTTKYVVWITSDGKVLRHGK